MKWIIEFNEDEKESFEYAHFGSDYSHAICEIKNKLRSDLKHGHTYKTADEALEYYQQMLFDLTEGLPE